MISPFLSTTIDPETPLALDLKSYIDAEDTYSWQWTKMPEGIAMNATGGLFELLAKGEIDQAAFVDMMGTAIADYTE